MTPYWFVDVQKEDEPGEWGVYIDFGYGLICSLGIGFFSKKDAEKMMAEIPAGTVHE